MDWQKEEEGYVLPLEPTTELNGLDLTCPFGCSPSIRLSGSAEGLIVERGCQHLCIPCNDAGLRLFACSGPCPRLLEWQEGTNDGFRFRFLQADFIVGERRHFKCPNTEGACSGTVVEALSAPGGAVHLQFSCPHVVRCRTRSHKPPGAPATVCTLVPVDGLRYAECRHTSKLVGGDGKAFKRGHKSPSSAVLDSIPIAGSIVWQELQTTLLSMNSRLQAIENRLTGMEQAISSLSPSIGRRSRSAGASVTSRLDRLPAVGQKRASDSVLPQPPQRRRHNTVDDSSTAAAEDVTEELSYDVLQSFLFRE